MKKLELTDEIRETCKRVADLTRGFPAAYTLHWRKVWDAIQNDSARKPFSAGAFILLINGKKHRCRSCKCDVFTRKGYWTYGCAKCDTIHMVQPNDFIKHVRE